MILEIGQWIYNWVFGYGGIMLVVCVALWIIWYVTPPLTGSKTPLLHAALIATGIDLASTYMSAHYFNQGYQVAINQVAANTKEAKDAISKAGQSVDDCNSRGGVWDTVSGFALSSAFLALPLAGCLTDGVGTKDAGAALPRAQYQVLGKTRYDQVWIDETIEGEVAGFGFARPQKRPPSWDATVVVPAKPAPIPLVTQPTPAVVTVAPKKTTLQRLRDESEKLNEKIRKLEGK